MAFEAFLADPQARPRRGQLIGLAASVGIHAPLVALFVVALLTHELVIGNARQAQAPVLGPKVTLRIPVSLSLGGSSSEIAGAGAGAPGAPGASAEAMVSAPGRPGGSPRRALVAPVAIVPHPEEEREPVAAADYALDGHDSERDDTGEGDKEGPNEGIAAFTYGEGDLGTGPEGAGGGSPGGEGDGIGPGGAGAMSGVGTGGGARRKGRATSGHGGGQPGAPGQELAPAAARADEAPARGEPAPTFISQQLAAYLRTNDLFPALPPSYWDPGHFKYLMLLEVCVSREGGVSDVRVKESATPEIDALVTTTIRSVWRYRPRVIAGVARPFCHPIRIVYERERRTAY